MKKILLAALLSAAGTFAYSQIKGTNTIGFGVAIEKSNSYINAPYEDENQSFQVYSLSYGRFIKDNLKIGFTGNFSSTKVSYTYVSLETESYGGNVHYQHYHSVLKKFYVFGRGETGYQFMKFENGNSTPTEHITDQVSLAGHGGVAYFLSKRFAFEADLISIGASYAKERESNDQGRGSRSSFRLSNSGIISGLGFKAYLLF